MVFRFTEPLLANEAGLPVYSDGYRLIALVHKYWTVRGKPLVLDEWQQELLIRILERCPESHINAGRMRFRQLVVSIPRQAGKSLLAAILSLYGLLQHCEAPKVLGVARGTEQAKIVYGYTYTAIASSPKLSSMFRQTETRGISKLKGLGSYKVLPAKPESIQGYESTMSICDELHVMKPEIWDAIVESQRAQTEPLLIGITTAGDITSTLLKRLYEQGDKSIAGKHETFGFFAYSSSSDDLTIESITEANPAVACGRISAQTILADCQGQPPTQWKRYTLNRFVDGLAEPWVPVGAWANCGGGGLTDFSGCVYSIDVTTGYSFASIYAAKKIDGVVHTALVARLVRPNIETLKDWAKKLRAAGRCSFILDGYRLRTLADWMVSQGFEVTRVGTVGTKTEAASIVYSLILRKHVNHDNQPLVNVQHSNAKTKAVGDSFVIVPHNNDADSVYASVYAIYGAEILKKRSIGIA